MVANAKKSDYQCPICQGRGRVPARLPGRQRLFAMNVTHGQDHAEQTRTVPEAHEAGARLKEAASLLTPFCCSTVYAMVTKRPTLGLPDMPSNRKSWVPIAALSLGFAGQ